MSFEIVKVYGDNNAWIGFLGSYIGSIVTLLGVLLTIRFTKNQARKEKLPEKITTVQECLDSIEDILEEMNKDQMFILDEDNKFFKLNQDYLIEITETHSKYIKEYPRKIRNFSVKIDTEAYKAFSNFTDCLDDNYTKNIGVIENNLNTFRKNMLDTYSRQINNLRHKDDFSLSKVILLPKDEEIIYDLRSSLWQNDYSYKSSLGHAYYQLKKDLQRILLRLTKEFND